MINKITVLEPLPRVWLRNKSIQKGRFVQVLPVYWEGSKYFLSCTCDICGRDCDAEKTDIQGMSRNYQVDDPWQCETCVDQGEKSPLAEETMDAFLARYAQEEIE